MSGQAQVGQESAMPSSVAALLPLAIILAVSLAVVLAAVVSSGGPNGRGFAGDFGEYVAGAQALRDRGNPYDQRALNVAQHRLFDPQHVRLPSVTAPTTVIVPPLLLWCLEPLTNFPYRTVAWLWMAAMYLLCATGAYFVLRYLGWTRWAVPGAMFLAYPQVVLGIYFGQVDGLIFAAICLGLLMQSSHPVTAGATLALVFFKPSVAVPIILLVLLFHVDRPRRVWMGFVAATAILALTEIAATGWTLDVEWLRKVSGFAGHPLTLGDVAPLAGAYTRSLGATPRTLLETTTLLAASVLTAFLRWRWRGRRVSVLQAGWVWVLWFLALPYGHFHDEILLAPPLLAALGRDSSRLLLPESLIPLYVLALSTPLVFFIPGGVQLLWAPLIIFAVCLAIAARREQAGQVVP